MTSYAVFLRGINVGGINIKMADLKEALKAGPFTGVKTLLASGNVVLASDLVRRRRQEGIRGVPAEGLRLRRLGGGAYRGAAWRRWWTRAPTPPTTRPRTRTSRWPRTRPCWLSCLAAEPWTVRS